MWPEVFESHQVGSYNQPVIPPTTEPDDGPLVCVAFNQDWLPYVLGSLMQLVNPSSWLVADSAALELALERATALLDIFGQAGACMTYALRFTDTCQLQFSVDGEETWAPVPGWVEQFSTCFPPQTQLRLTDTCELQESVDGGSSWDAVVGWDANFGPCVQENAPIIGLPPNPGDESPKQFACSIASYLANEVILNAMQAGVTAITDDLTLLSFGASVLNLIPEFIFVRLGYDAVSIIYTAIAEGTLSDYEAAVADGTLWNEVTCAIYNAISADGFVTPANFGAIISNVNAISYSSDVIGAISSYLESLGATGLAQLSQRAGLLVGASCGCETGAWCNTWQAGARNMCGGDWTAIPFGSCSAVATCATDEWSAALCANPVYNMELQCILPSARTITQFFLHFTMEDETTNFDIAFYDESDTLITVIHGVVAYHSSDPPIVGVKRIVFSQQTGLSGEFFTCGAISLLGDADGSPWGESDC